MMVIAGFACMELWLSIWDCINGIPERVINHAQMYFLRFASVQTGQQSHVGKLTDANSLLERKPI